MTSTTNPNTTASMTANSAKDLQRALEWVGLKQRGPAMWAPLVYKQKRALRTDIPAAVREKAEAEAEYLIRHFYLRVLPSEREHMVQLLEGINSWKLLQLEATGLPVNPRHHLLADSIVDKIKVLLTEVLQRSREQWMDAYVAENEHNKTPSLFGNDG